MTPTPPATQREREYLEVIYYLRARGEPVIAARVADWLKVSAPTVSNALKRLERKGFVARDAGGTISFSPAGLALGEQIVRQHRLLECFLVDVMGLPWDVIHEEAVRLERMISPRFEERIEQLVGNSRTCPHGNPVPGNASDYDGAIRLDQAPPGESLALKRIVEEAEEDTELMAYFYHNGLVPGAVVQIAPGASKYGGLAINTAKSAQPVMLAPEIAAVLWCDLV